MNRPKTLLLFVILITNFSLQAQNDTVNFKNQFQFHLINGYSLSYFNLLCPSSGIRYKIDLNLSGSSRNSDQVQDYDNNQAVNEQKFNRIQENASQYFNVVVNYIWTSNIANEVKLYAGIGPLVSYSRYHNESNSETPSSGNYTYSKSVTETTSSFFGIGLQGVIGVECSLTEKISLLAEFNLDVTYGWDHWQYDDEDESTSLHKTLNSEDGNSWNYGLNNLKLGIAYRF